MRPSRPCWTLALLASAALAAPEPKPPADPSAEYAERSAKLAGKKDAKAWLALADFCEEHLLFEKRSEALARAVEAEPESPQARSRVDQVKWDGAWIPAGEADAKEIEKSQAKGLVFYGAKWAPPKEAEKAREADRKAQGWAVEVRIDAPHLTLYSGRSLEDTRRVAALLENEIGAYQRLYGKTWKCDPRFKGLRAYLFADRATYARIREAQTQSAPPPASAGFYCAVNQTLYIGSVENPSGKSYDPLAAALTDGVHEMNHALDHLLSHCYTDLPPWVQEGRAEYFGYAVSGRQVIPGLACFPPESLMPNHLERGLQTLDLPGLLDLAQKDFTGPDVLEHYALSWGFVHFLFHGEGGAHAAAFRAYLAGFPAKGSRADFEKAAGRTKDLEPAFRRYVTEELLPQARAQSGGRP